MVDNDAGDKRDRQQERRGRSGRQQELGDFIEKNKEERHHIRNDMVRPSGLEPPTPTMSRWCSNQLSYGRSMVRSIGLEPTTPTMSRWCSNQLSYERNVVGDNGDEY